MTLTPSRRSLLSKALTDAADKYTLEAIETIDQLGTTALASTLFMRAFEVRALAALVAESTNVHIHLDRVAKPQTMPCAMAAGG